MDSSVASLAVAELLKDEFPAVAALLGRAYRDNPLSIALLGEETERRQNAVERIHSIRIAALDCAPLGARSNGAVVGVCAYEPPDPRPMAPGLQHEMLTALDEVGEGVLARAQHMLAEFVKHRPAEPHWRLGPVAVSPDLQGSGIGSRMVSEFCARMDAIGAVSHLETDQSRNVRLYERFGFRVENEAQVLDVPMWFMTRRAGHRG